MRIEELVNYFHYAYPPPSGGNPFSFTTEVGPSPWNPRYKLVRISALAQDAIGPDVEGYRKEFLTLAAAAAKHRP